MISGSSTLELDTDSDTAKNKLDESVSLTRMGEEVLFLSEPSLAVVMEQSLVPGWSVVVVIGDVGTSFAVLCDGNNVVVIDLHAHEEHGSANLGWEYGLCLPHWAPSIKNAEDSSSESRSAESSEITRNNRTALNLSPS